ncbi:hypothetical protein EON63_18840 [archaeon]|nr:MAG: hypothetical protein EON63_18840 [archaeon]
MHHSSYTIYYSPFTIYLTSYTISLLSLAVLPKERKISLCSLVWVPSSLAGSRNCRRMQMRGPYSRPGARRGSSSIFIGTLCVCAWLRCESVCMHGCLCMCM